MSGKLARPRSRMEPWEAPDELSFIPTPANPCSNEIVSDLMLALFTGFRFDYALYWSIPTVAGLGPVGITRVLALSAPTTTM